MLTANGEEAQGKQCTGLVRNRLPQLIITKKYKQP